MKVIIAGAGFIGRKLAEKLLEAGHQVRVLTRDHRCTKLPAGVAVIEWNPPSGGDWTTEVQEADAIVNLCGEGIAERRWTPGRKRALLESRIVPTRAIVEALGRSRRQGTTLINSSAIGFYGNEGGVADERTPKGSGFLAGVCESWEAEAKRAADFGIRTVLLRTGVVLGPGGGALKKMLPPFRLGIGGRLGTGRQWFSWIHQDDIAGLIERCLTDKEFHGPVNAVSPGAVTNADFTAALGRALHRPTIFPVPAVMLKLILGEMSSMLLEGRKVTPAAALANGFQFQYPEIDIALRAAIAR